MRSLALLLCGSLLFGCVSTSNEEVVYRPPEGSFPHRALGFLGWNAQSGENWKYALKQPYWYVPAAGATAALLQIDSADRRLQQQLTKANLFSSNTEHTMADAGLFGLAGLSLVLPLVIQPHPEREVPGIKYSLTAGYALIANALLTGIVQDMGLRTRPDHTSHSSFWSGHSAGSFASATLLEREYGWKVGIPAYGVATTVAFLRVDANRHFPADVLFGAAVGSFVSNLIYEKNLGAHGYYLQSTRAQLVPLISPSFLGVGLHVSW